MSARVTYLPETGIITIKHDHGDFAYVIELSRIKNKKDLSEMKKRLERKRWMTDEVLSEVLGIVKEKAP